MLASKMLCLQCQHLLDGRAIRAVDELTIDKDTSVEGDLSLVGEGVKLVGEDSGHNECRWEGERG